VLRQKEHTTWKVSGSAEWEALNVSGWHQHLQHFTERWLNTNRERSTARFITRHF